LSTKQKRSGPKDRSHPQGSNGPRRSGAGIAAVATATGTAGAAGAAHATSATGAARSALVRAAEEDLEDAVPDDPRRLAGRDEGGPRLRGGDVDDRSGSARHDEGAEVGGRVVPRGAEVRVERRHLTHVGGDGHVAEAVSSVVDGHAEDEAVGDQVLVPHSVRDRVRKSGRNEEGRHVVVVTANQGGVDVVADLAETERGGDH